MTIRTRLTFLYSSLLAIVILMFSAATSSVLNWTLRNQVDHTLLESAQKVQNDLDPSTFFPAYTTSSENRLILNSWVNTPSIYVQVWRRDSQTGMPDMLDQSWNLKGMGYTHSLDPDALNQNYEIRRDVTVDGEHRRVVTIPLIQNGQVYGYIQTASSLRTVDAAIDRLLKIMLVGGAIALLASLLLGDMLSQRALKPINTIAQAAQQITAADDLSRRIPYDGPPDEIGQLTETFNETLERLERLFRAQRRFVADVSHEMRTPLTTIQGNLDLMKRFSSDYDQEAMEAMEGEVRRMSRLVEDLLLLAKADAGRMSLTKMTVELDTLLLEVYNQARLLSNSSVDVRLGGIDQVQVLGDPDRLKQLLLNLVSNAVKYTPEGGMVTLVLSRDDHSAYVAVTDTGIGIPEADLPHIFDRFYRVDKARARAMGGTGLGLSIAKWIADAHGGQLSVVSTVGEGSTFTIQLPLAPESVPADSLRETRPNMRAMQIPRTR